MIERLKKDWLVHLLCLLLTLFYFWGFDLVPFHPDESTQIYMSEDLFDLFRDPLSLSYSPGVELTNKMTYRAIDAPLTRYMIGFARFLSRTPGLVADWNWSMAWEQNQASGAYPSSALLNSSRFILTLLIPISLYFFYFSIRKILPQLPALFALLYLGLNPLILLHGRRAMAEPVLLFGITFFLWVITQNQINPILVGIALALTFNAKQTGAILIPVGIIAVCMTPNDKLRLKNMLARSAAVLTVFLLSTLILNPYYWKSPFNAIQIGIQLRSQVLVLQMADYIQGATPNLISSLFSLVSNLYLSPPAYFETTKYLNPLVGQINIYQGVLPHIWGRNLISGSLLFTLVLSGLFVVIKRFPLISKPKQQKILLWFLTSISLTSGILIALPIPWQRYVIPLLPLNAFWFGFALLPLTDALKPLSNRSTPHPDTPG